MENVDLYLKYLNHSELQVDDFTFNDGSGAGGNLLQKNQILQIGGIKDSDFHNHGQDNVLFHEISNYCSHIDTATFGLFMLKLPITNSGNRLKIKKRKAKTFNVLDYLTFEKKNNQIDLNYIDVINSLNLPKKKVEFKFENSIENKNNFSLKDLIECVAECIIFTVFSVVSLKSQDIYFAIKIKRLIKKFKIKNIFLDEAQSLRFTSYLAKSIPDLSFFIILNSEKHSELDILKLRNNFASRLKILNHHGYLKVINFNQFNFKSLNTYDNYCTIEELTSQINNLPNLNKDANSNKINTYRKVEKKSKFFSYIIERNGKLEEKNFNTFHLDIFINSLIYIFKLFLKMRRFLGDIKRSLNS